MSPLISLVGMITDVTYIVTRRRDTSGNAIEGTEKEDVEGTWNGSVVDEGWLWTLQGDSIIAGTKDADVREWLEDGKHRRLNFFRISHHQVTEFIGQGHTQKL